MNNLSKEQTNILTQDNLRQFCDAMLGLSCSCTKVTDSLQALTTILQVASLRPMGDYEKCKHLKR